MLDLNKWTLADVIKFEELANVSIDQVSNGMNAKAMAAMVYVEEHRKNSKVTFESIISKPMEEIAALLESYSTDESQKK